MLQFIAADAKLSCDSVDGIELAGEALNKNAIAVMPKNQWGGWYNSVIAGDFLVQNLETRIHMFLGRLRTARRGVPLFAHPDSAVSANDVFADDEGLTNPVLRPGTATPDGAHFR